MAVVRYALDDQTVVRFEVELGEDFRPAGHCSLSCVGISS